MAFYLNLETVVYLKVNIIGKCIQLHQKMAYTGLTFRKTIVPSCFRSPGYH